MSTRKRVSQACKTCNQKKVKCDGAFPRCSTCHSRNEECSYGISKRRGPNRRAEYNASIGSLAENLGRVVGTIQTPNRTNPIPVNLQTPDCLSAISPATSKRLFQIYFECIHPTWPLLYKPLYASLDFASPYSVVPAPLILAIFAIASCIDDGSHPTRVRGPQGEGSCPEPRVFFEGALSILEEGPDASKSRQSLNIFFPSVTNCQVLVILALQQHGVAEYSRAALLCSLAAAMAIELRINREYKHNDSVEREVRSRLWWNLYILEKMMAGETGRPVLLRSEETDCPWPSLAESDEFELMSPKLQNSIGLTRKNPIKMRTVSALYTTISLSMIMERVYRDIYGIAARKIIREDQNAGEQLRMQLWRDLQAWERDLDASPLKLDLSDELTSVPPVITNLVIMFTGTILLQRPFVDSWRPELVVGEVTLSPYEICLQAANRICVILEKYLGRLTEGPCDLIFSIFTAASILLQHTKQAGNVDVTDTQRRLKQCIHWLSVLGKSWKTAGARRQLLDDLSALPQPLQESRATEETSAHQLASEQVPSTDILNTVVQPPIDQHQFGIEDWSFLKDFGDFTDQFYSWDVELRDLLDGQFTLG